MSVLEKTVTNVSEYISTVTDLRSSHEKLWFRGHADSAYVLQPSVYRHPFTWENEESLLHQFKARAARFINNPPTSDMEWLFIMQHHTTPTRLLDWSENALVALAFATQYRLEKHIGKDAAVWCLDPKKLNDKTRFPSFKDEPIPNICENSDLIEMFKSPRQSYPVSIIGPQNTDRIIAQRGVFTLFPNKDSFSMESLSDADTFLVKIIIPDDKVQTISEDLYYLGMTESTLFPELDSISTELRKQYSGRGV